MVHAGEYSEPQSIQLAPMVTVAPFNETRLMRAEPRELPGASTR